MSITVNTKTFSSYRSDTDKVVMAGPTNTMTAVDVVEFGRVFPKLASDGHGVARPRCNRRKTVNATQAGVVKQKEAILGFAGSLPIGMADADIDTLCDDFASLVGSATFKTFLKTLAFPA